MAREISNMDDVIDSRDIIKRIDELENDEDAGKWLAGWNMPGFMPDNPPARFHDWKDARDHLTEAMGAELDELEDNDENGAAIDDLRANIKAWDALREDRELGETCGRFHYFLTMDETEESRELDTLRELAKEGEQYAPDWSYGATLIRDSYFVEYCQDLVQDIGDLPNGIPHYIEIDWEATARNIRMDYTSIEFDDVTYWIR